VLVSNFLYNITHFLHETVITKFSYKVQYITEKRLTNHDGTDSTAHWKGSHREFLSP